MENVIPIDQLESAIDQAVEKMARGVATLRAKGIMAEMDEEVSFQAVVVFDWQSLNIAKDEVGETTGIQGGTTSEVQGGSTSSRQTGTTTSKQTGTTTSNQTGTTTSDQTGTTTTNREVNEDRHEEQQTDYGHDEKTTVDTSYTQ
jgi:hypothetical protein